jgi:predicted dienelactone hydrolase
MFNKTLQIILLFVLSICSVNAQFKISQQTKSYYDGNRNRELKTEIWIPEESSSEPFRLIIFSHGTGGNRLACQWFCEGLAKKGFMIAAVDHYGNTYTNPIPKEFVTVWQRPLDISFILSKLLSEKEFAGRIDEGKIYAAGFSLGGYTSIALAGAEFDLDNFIRFIHTPQGFKEANIPEMPGLIDLFEKDSIKLSFKTAPCLKDNRIKAVFVMAPALGQGYSSKDQMKEVNIPIFVAGVQSDSIAPIITNALHYKKLLPKAEWYLIKGNAGHYIFLNEGNEEMKQSIPAFFKDPDDVDRNKIHLLMINKAASFFSDQR